MSVSGQWSMEASNLLPFDLTECRLMLSACRAEVTTDNQNRRMYGIPPTATTLTVRIVPGNANIILENLPASASKTSAIEGVTFYDTQAQTQGYRMNNARIIVPHAAYKGATAAWFVARISKSPLLSIDDRESDFEPLKESHYFVQEICPEQLPTEWTGRHEAWLDMQLKFANEQVLKTKQGADF